MASKESDEKVTSTETSAEGTVKEELQVVDEVHESFEGEEEIMEGEEQDLEEEEEGDYLNEEDEEELGDELGEEDLAEDDLAEDEQDEELATEEEPAATGDGDAEGDKSIDEAAAGDGEAEEKKVKEEEKDAKDEESKDEEDDSIPRCPIGHKLREDTNSNRFGCTADDCRRKNDPNIIDGHRAKDGREHRERLFLPNYKSFKIDLKVASKVRSVIAGPLDLEDLQKENVREIINQAEEFFVRFHREGEDNKCTGHVQFRFASFEEATTAVEKIEKLKEGLTVKQLVGGLNVGRVDKLIRGVDEDVDVPAETVKNLVSVCGLPPNATKEQLAELFPQARIRLMAMKANGTPKGYAYIECTDEEAAKKQVEEHNAKPHVLEGHKLYLEKMQAPLELFMVVDSDDVLTEEERAKIVRTLNVSQLQLDRRGTRMKTKEYQDLVRKVRMLKQKLSMDNRKRREKGMSLPKPAIRRPPGASGRPNYAGSRGRMNRPDGRGGRRDMSNRSSMRSPASRRPVHRGDDRYSVGHSPSPRGEGGYYSYGGSPSSRRDMGPPRRTDSERGGRYSEGRGSSRYANERGRSGKLNTHQTANAVNMLVGLTSLLSEMQRKTPGSAPDRRDTGRSNAAGSSSRDSWQQPSYSERSRQRSGDYGGSSGGGGAYSSSSSSYRESASYRDDWGSSRGESMRSSGGGGGHYDDSYYEDRGSRKRAMTERGGYNDDYYGRSDRGGMKRAKMSRGRGGGGGGRGRY